MTKISLGNGWDADVYPPNRGDFDRNFGGDVAYSLAQGIYYVVEGAGVALGAFLGSGLVSFLEHIEPEMVEYTSPIIDLALSFAELPPDMREALEKIKVPTDPVGAILLPIVAAVIIPSMIGPVTGTLMKGPVQEIEQITRQSLASPSDAIAMARRSTIDWARAERQMTQAGYPDDIIAGMKEISRARPDVSTLVEGVRRGWLSPESLAHELGERGYPEQDRAVVLGLVDELVDLGSIMTAYYRDTISEGDAKNRMGKLGYTPSDQDLILSNSKVIPGVADLVQMAVREAWDDGVASDWGYDADFSPEFADWAEKQGLSTYWAQKYWRAHWALPSVTLAFQMYHREIIGREELEALLRTADYPAGWRDRMIEAAYQPITRVDVRRFYRLGLFDRNELVSRYSHLGYSPDDAENMADFTVAYEGSGGEDESAEARNLTRTLIEKAYRAGQLTREESAFELETLRYTTEHIELMLSLVDTQRDLDAVPDFLTDYRKDMQSVLIKSYTKRIISGQDLSQYLIELGFDAQEADLQMQVADFAYADAMRDTAIDLIGENYVRRTISQGQAYEYIGGLNIASSQQDQLFSEWDLQRTLRTRKLTEAQYRKAYQGELIDLDTYGENMRGLGYSEGDVEILLKMADD